MSRAIRFVAGRFGRIALLDMSAPLVTHAHHHCHLLVKTGGQDAAFRVRDRCCPLSDLQAVLVNAWEPHAYLHQPRAGASTEILALYIEPEWLADAELTCDAAGATALFPQTSALLAPRTQRLAEAMAAALRAPDGPEDLHFEALLAALLAAFVQPARRMHRPGRLPPSPATLAPQDSRIRRAMALMRDRIGVDLDSRTVAAHCGLSRAHFFELFYRTTRMTPAIYNNELRMEAAFDWLAHSGDAIGSVSDRLGFSAPGHFTRFFRGHIGVTPRDYRKAVGGDAR